MILIVIAWTHEKHFSYWQKVQLFIWALLSADIEPIEAEVSTAEHRGKAF